jgi:ribonuclease G
VKRLLISRDGSETRVALVEDGRLSEFYVEHPRRLSRVGNIYKGRVENVLAGMDAAFVDIGLERNGYLHVEEIACPGQRSGRDGKKITDLLRAGDEVLVQVIRDVMGSKGPRLSTQLSFAGHYVVYMPGSTASGASRRLADQERERLRTLCKLLSPADGGLIARTAAEDAAEEDVDRELRYLSRLWDEVVGHAATVRAPNLVYAEMELALRAARDLAGREMDAVLVDDTEVCRRVVDYLQKVAPVLVPLVELYQGTIPLFETYGLERDVRRALARRVDLPSGGYLVIDHTEAMTVVDVNTGRYVGRRFLEDTTLKTNLEACREIVRQLRLRDIGGIIVIDFIDMSVEANREAVLAELRAQSAADRTKTYVMAVSPLGLVEMTRQNVTLGLREVMTDVCPTCRGEGRVLSEESAASAVVRHILSLARASVLPGVRVQVHPRMLALLQEGAPSRLQEVQARSGRFVSLTAADEAVPLDHVKSVPD